MSKVSQISQILNQFTGKKNVEQLRINALVSQGFNVESMGEKLNFGTSGTVKETSEGILFQSKCASAVKSRKTGYTYNACKIFRVS